jgi:hypothetical protein
MGSQIKGNLPGGILLGSELHKGFSFKSLERIQALLFRMHAAEPGNFPALISEFLNQALDSLGGQPVTLEAVRYLSVGDRQFLIRELAAHIHANSVWLNIACGRCAEKMDVSFRYADLPVKNATGTFPEFTLQLDKKTLRVRVPNGADQEAIAELSEAEQALHMLLQRIVRPVGKGRALFNLDTTAAAAIENAVETVAPELGTTLVAPCPHCAAENHVTVDLYAFVGKLCRELVADVHQIASAYHWTEQDILALPQQRRKHYLALIDRARGMVSGT